MLTLFCYLRQPPFPSPCDSPSACTLARRRPARVRRQSGFPTHSSVVIIIFIMRSEPIIRIRFRQGANITLPFYLVVLRYWCMIVTRSPENGIANYRSICLQLEDQQQARYTNMVLVRASQFLDQSPATNGTANCPATKYTVIMMFKTN